MTNIESQFIRKAAWMQIINNYKEVSRSLKQKIILNHYVKVNSRVELSKRKFINHLMNRKDHSLIIAS